MSRTTGALSASPRVRIEWITAQADPSLPLPRRERGEDAAEEEEEEKAEEEEWPVDVLYTAQKVMKSL
jgi:hypothetical protein